MPHYNNEYLFSQFETNPGASQERCAVVARAEENGYLLSTTETDGWNLGTMIHMMACPTCREKMQKANAITALRKSMVKWIDPDFDGYSQQSTK